MFSHLLEYTVNIMAAVVILTLGILVLRKNREDMANRLFALMVTMNALWIFTSATVDLLQSDLGFALQYTRLAIVPAFFFFPTFFYFTKAFALPTGVKLDRRWALIYLPAVLCLPLVPTAFNVAEVVRRDWGIDFTPGPLYPVLLLYVLLTVTLGIRELIRKYRRSSDATTRAQIKFLLIGFFIFIVLALMANAILPVMGYGRAVIYGPSSTIFFIVFAFYAIVRHHLLNVKVIAAEMFGVLLAFVTFFQLFSADSVADFGLRVFIFLATAVVAVFLIRSVLQEVRRREEIQHLASELSVTNKRLRQLDDLKTTMVSIASHQIRGPLGGIRGYMTMFRDGDLGPLTDKQKEIVTLNLNVTTRLLNAVETFLDITKLESGKLTLRKEVLPLDDAVADVVEEFKLPAQKKGLVFNLAFECGRPVWVEFDPEKIKHVIFNLIDNAMKYTEQGKIDVHVRCDGREAVFEVTDTGMGIPPEDASRLFGKYERGELVIDRGGSGLGLYIVKMLTEMQGGRVWATSPGVGKGSTFSVALPLARDFDPTAGRLVQ